MCVNKILWFKIEIKPSSHIFVRITTCVFNSNLWHTFLRKKNQYSVGYSRSGQCVLSIKLIYDIEGIFFIFYFVLYYRP